MKFARFCFCLVAILPTILSAQVELIAGWNFGQFIGAGAPSTDGTTGGPTESIPSNYSGFLRPGEGDSGPGKIGGSDATAFSAGTGVLSFSAWDFASGSDIIVVELGSLISINAETVSGSFLYSGDPNNAHLRFISGAVTDFTITVNTTGFSDYDPAVTTQPNDANFTFAAYRASGSSATITWLVDGVTVGTSTVASDIFTAFSVDLPPGFYGKANASLVGRVSGDVVIDHLQINGIRATPVTFTQQPQSQTVTSGGAASFSVTVTGAAAPTYRWFFGATPLADGPGVSGSATATLSLTGVTPARAGAYRVEVNNNGAVAESDPATLTVNVAPTFAAQPAASVNGNPGDTVLFEVEASGSPAPAYQWFKGETALADDARISGATTDTLTIAGLLLADAGDYTVVVTNAAGFLRSSVSVLSVTVASVAPTIQSAPLAATAVIGQPATFRVTASGAPAPTYQWFKGETALADGAGVSGATTATLRVTPSSLADAGAYRVVVTNSAGSVGSDPVQLTVWSRPSIPVESAPVGGRVDVGGRFVFEVEPDGVPAPTYQWFKDGQPLEGETGAQLVIDPASSEDAGDYTVLVTNGAGSVESEPATLEVTVFPLITTQPVSRVVGTGSDVTFQVVATGSPPLTYQWFKNDEPLDGATAAILNLTAVDLADAGNYQVFVSNAGGTQPSAVVRLDVLATVRRSAAVQSFAPGAQLSVDSGFAPSSGYRFQWLRNGRVIPGATSSTYQIDSAAFADTGTYAVRVLSAAGRLLSTITVARLNVNVAGVYDLLLRDEDTSEPSGLVTVSVSATGAFTGRLTYSDGRVYPFRGRFDFGVDEPYLGTTDLTLRRPGGLPALALELILDARESLLVAGLEEPSAETDILADGSAAPRLAATARPAWAGSYNLSLAPLPTTLPGQPGATPVLRAVIAPVGGTMRITGRLADNTPLTVAVPAASDSAYSLWLRLYSGRGHLAGALDLVEVSANNYKADLGSSGTFGWFRPANPRSPVFPGGIDLLLAPELVKP